jgi:hypothetical protein
MANFQVDKIADPEVRGVMDRIGGFHDRLTTSQPPLTATCSATQGSSLTKARACRYARSILTPLIGKYGVNVDGSRRDERPIEVSDRIHGEVRQLVNAFDRDTGDYNSQMKRCLQQQGLLDRNHPDNATRGVGSDCRRSNQSGGRKPHR